LAKITQTTKDYSIFIFILIKNRLIVNFTKLFTPYKIKAIIKTS